MTDHVRPDLEAITARAEKPFPRAYLNQIKRDLESVPYTPPEVITDGARYLLRVALNYGGLIAEQRADALELVAALRAAWDRIAELERAPQMVEDRDGDLWVLVAPGLWRCLTAGSVDTLGGDLAAVFGPLRDVDLTPHATTEARS